MESIKKCCLLLVQCQLTSLDTKVHFTFIYSVPVELWTLSLSVTLISVHVIIQPSGTVTFTLIISHTGLFSVVLVKSRNLTSPCLLSSLQPFVEAMSMERQGPSSLLAFQTFIPILSTAPGL